MKPQPWISSAAFDTAFILSLPFVSLFIVLMLPEDFRSTAIMPVASWVALVLCIDVGHVYSTLFRTYFDKERMVRQRRLFLAVPVLCYVAGVMIYTVSGLLFGRILAYLAVFHFIRQQYGFMRLYSRKEAVGVWAKRIDILAVYSATLFPIIYWHLSPGRNFNWFIDGDFVQLESAGARGGLSAFYVLVTLVYIAKELRILLRGVSFNLPRNLLIGGTAIAWYFGIVYFNGDMAFTLLNVVSHGIPYMALIWATSRKEQQSATRRKGFTAVLLRSYGLVVFVGLLLLFAYLEEGLWDGLVWKEHGAVFGLFQGLPQVADSSLLALLIPLLSLPQSTHYVLDGFIWRKGD